MAVTQEEGGAGLGRTRTRRRGTRGLEVTWLSPGGVASQSNGREARIRSFLPPKTPTACNRACYWLGRSEKELDVVQTQRAGALPRALKRSALHLLSTSK